jgi:hypothetical protein
MKMILSLNIWSQFGITENISFRWMSLIFLKLKTDSNGIIQEMSSSCHLYFKNDFKLILNSKNESINTLLGPKTF